MKLQKNKQQEGSGTLYKVWLFLSVIKILSLTDTNLQCTFANPCNMKRLHFHISRMYCNGKSFRYNRDKIYSRTICKIAINSGKEV